MAPAPLEPVAPVATNPAYGFFADAIVIVHFLFMAFIVFGQLAIIIAACFKWSWGRNPWFRFLHLASILLVVYEAVMQIRCPLTKWEEDLRVLAGQQMGDSTTFIGFYAHHWLFWDDKTSSEVIFAVTICFGIIVVQGLVMYPPRWFKRRCCQPVAPAPAPSSAQTTAVS
ncbi:MAG: DUF2784 domain-containing protein [Gemmataceae bacterium]